MPSKGATPRVAIRVGNDEAFRLERHLSSIFDARHCQKRPLAFVESDIWRQSSSVSAPCDDRKPPRSRNCTRADRRHRPLQLRVLASPHREIHDGRRTTKGLKHNNRSALLTTASARCSLGLTAFIGQHGRRERRNRHLTMSTRSRLRCGVAIRSRVAASRTLEIHDAISILLKAGSTGYKAYKACLATVFLETRSARRLRRSRITSAATM